MYTIKFNDAVDLKSKYENVMVAYRILAETISAFLTENSIPHEIMELPIPGVYVDPETIPLSLKKTFDELLDKGWKNIVEKAYKENGIEEVNKVKLILPS